LNTIIFKVLLDKDGPLQLTLGMYIKKQQHVLGTTWRVLCCVSL